MTVLLLLIFASLALAGAFLGAFIWAVRAGQFEDTCTPSMRVLTEETNGKGHPSEEAILEPRRVRIPLTPALSQRERVNRRQSRLKSRRATFANSLTRILPLPLGEGRGEGNSDCASTSLRFTSTQHATRNTDQSHLFQAPTTDQSQS